MKKYTAKYKWEDKTRPHHMVPIPYCYKVDPDDPLHLLPDMDIIKAVEKALDYINEGNAIRKVAEWLSTTTKKDISHQGLEYIWKKQCGNDPHNPRVKEARARKRARAPKTPEEKYEYEAKKRLAVAKRATNREMKKIAAIQAAMEARQRELTIEPEEIEYPPFDPNDESLVLPHEFEGREIGFSPNPGPQTDFLAAGEQEVLFGGQAGGGKSYALITDPMRYFDNPNFRGILFRRTNDELKEIKWKATELYLKIFPEAKWREKDGVWKFPSGAEYWFTYLDRDEDVTRYQGQSFSYVAFDELTQYATPFAWDYMRSRLRTVDPTLPLFQRATTNPGGVGHGWVKKMFIDPAPYGQAFTARDINTDKELVYPDNYRIKSLRGKPLFQRRFIPSKLSDNPYLYTDGEYEKNLLGLPEHLKAQLLYGDWNLVEGAAFPEFRVGTHVIPPYTIPKSWRRFRSCDYGYASHTAVHWYAIDPIYETLIVYRELYVSKMTGKALANEILRIEKAAEEKPMYGILDSSVWAQRGNPGPSIAEEMISAGCSWRPSDRSKGARTSGKNRLHELLKVTEWNDGKQTPGIVFFDTCRQIIADLQVIPVDPDGKDDIDERYASDHAYDSIRYGIMSRPRGTSPWDNMNTFIQPSYQPSDRAFGY